VIPWNRDVISWNRDVILWNHDVILVFAARSLKQSTPVAAIAEALVGGGEKESCPTLCGATICLKEAVGACGRKNFLVT